MNSPDPVKQTQPSKHVDIKHLEAIALGIRKDILTMLSKARSGHTGGSLSCVELLVGLYHYKMRHNPKDPDWADRDIFVISKGHAAPALYATLASCGYFPREELMTLRKLGSRLQGHAYIGVPGIEASTGSLGMGLSIANGFALAARLNKSERRMYVLLGDGETDEGQIWEAAMTSSHYKLDNVCAILDANNLQIDGFVEAVKRLEPIKDKWHAFGWNVIEIDGHDLAQVLKAYDEAECVKGKPTVVLARTIKGKGVSFMENEAEWHGIAPKPEELDKALKELGE